MYETRLQDAVVALARFAHDAVEGVTDVGEADRSMMRDTRRRVAQENAYKLSEVLFLDQPAGLTGTNPKAVTKYDATAGRFWLNDPYGPASGVPEGVHYVLLNLGGGGTTYLSYLSALNLGLVSLLGGWDVQVDTVLTDERATSMVVPDGLDSLYAVGLVDPNTGLIASFKPGRGGWRVEPPRTLILGPLRGTATSLRLYGRVYGRFLGPSAALQTVLPASISDLVAAGAEYVHKDSARPREMSVAMQLTQERLRTRPPIRYPNEVLLGRAPLVVQPLTPTMPAFAQR